MIAGIAVVTFGCGLDDALPDVEQRFHDLNKGIMCPVCPGESIDQSQNTLAVQMRQIVMNKIQEGWSNEEITQFFVDRYGPSVLMSPPLAGFNVTVWLVPPIATLLAFTCLYFMMQKMRRRSASDIRDLSGEVNMAATEESGYFATVSGIAEVNPLEKEGSRDPEC